MKVSSCFFDIRIYIQTLIFQVIFFMKGDLYYGRCNNKMSIVFRQLDRRN